MQANNAPLVQFGAGGEQWWQIPPGAILAASDGVTVGTVMEIGTAYLRAGSSMMADGDVYIPLQMIGMYDAQTNTVHLTTTSEAVRAMFGVTPANDPASLQAFAGGSMPLPTAPRVNVRETHIALREQEVVVSALPNVVKDVTVRRERMTGAVTMTETVRHESAAVETDEA